MNARVFSGARVLESGLTLHSFYVKVSKRALSDSLVRGCGCRPCTFSGLETKALTALSLQAKLGVEGSPEAFGEFLACMAGANP